MSDKNAQMIARINRNLKKVGGESQRVLTYIKSELTPEAVERRSAAEAGGEDHLFAVANTLLRSVEPRQENS